MFPMSVTSPCVTLGQSTYVLDPAAEIWLAPDNSAVVTTLYNRQFYQQCTSPSFIVNF
jgi:hypothetical protein